MFIKLFFFVELITAYNLLKRSIMLIIKNGAVAEHESGKFIKKNIVIKSGKIAAICGLDEKIDENPAAEVIDASGLIVSAGFIDVHSHGDLTFVMPDAEHPKLNQGVTTEIVGNCGLSVVPLNENQKKEFYSRYSSIWGEFNVKWDWNSIKDYSVLTENAPTNIPSMIGYSTLRYILSGLNSSVLSENQENKLEEIIEQELSEGALGISFGIPYAPNIYAEKKEYRLALKLAAKYDKIAAFHIRDEGANLLDSISEIFDFNKDIGCSIHISHLKTYGKANWNNNDQAISMIEKYSINNSISFDVYPYTAGSTSLSYLLPSDLLSKNEKTLINELRTESVQQYVKQSFKQTTNWIMDQDFFDNILPVGLTSEKYRGYEGNSIGQLSREMSLEPGFLICDIIAEEKNRIAMIMFLMDETNVRSIMRHPLSFIGSDGLYNKFPHPRTYGTFPRFIGKYCMEEKLLSLSEGLEKITAKAAERFGIKNKGKIAAGYDADLVLFDSTKIKDRADYKEPKNFPAGISYVLKNGEKVIFPGGNS